MVATGDYDQVNDASFVQRVENPGEEWPTIRAPQKGFRRAHAY